MMRWNGKGHVSGIPEYRKADIALIQKNYRQIKRDVEDIVETEMETMLTNPAKRSMLIKK